MISILLDQISMKRFISICPIHTQIAKEGSVSLMCTNCTMLYLYSRVDADPYRKTGTDSWNGFNQEKGQIEDFWWIIHQKSSMNVRNGEYIFAFYLADIVNFCITFLTSFPSLSPKFFETWTHSSSVTPEIGMKGQTSRAPILREH